MAKSFNMSAFKNIAVGIGDSDHDPSVYDNDGGLENLYAHNWLASKCVDVHINDSLSKWRNTDKKIDYGDNGRSLNIIELCRSIATKARIDGYCTFTPRLEGIKNLPSKFDTSLFVNNKCIGIDFHRKVSDRNKEWAVTINSQWHLAKSRQIINAASTAEHAARIISSKVNVDVYKVKNLIDQIEGCGSNDDPFVNRMSLMSMTANLYHALIIDADHEEYERHEISSDAVIKIYDSLLRSVAHSANIDITRFAPQQSTGIQNSGASSLKAHYDAVRSLQSSMLSKIIYKLDEYNRLSYGVDVGVWDWIELESPKLDDKVKASALYADMLEYDIPNAAYHAAVFAIEYGLFDLSQSELFDLMD